MKGFILIILVSLTLFTGCTNSANDPNKQVYLSESCSDCIHSTSLFEIKEVEKNENYGSEYLVSINQKFLPDEFKEIKIKKTAYHVFDPSPAGIYIHDSTGSGNYGTYKFLIIYHDLNQDYDINGIVPLPLTLVEQNSDYSLYSYDGYYSEDNFQNHYTGKIITFNHNNKKAFILVGQLEFTTSTEYKLKNYYHLP